MYVGKNSWSNLLMPELHCWVGLNQRLATCTANRKVPPQKSGVMVGHLHSTAKRPDWVSFLRNYRNLSQEVHVGTGAKTSEHRYWGQSICVSQK